jgi:formamidopyrimidine-DNA glycosylase
MPELPEVETIARRLRDGTRDGPPILGREIQALEVRWKRHLAFPGEAEAAQRIRGQVFQSVGRRGRCPW